MGSSLATKTLRAGGTLVPRNATTANSTGVTLAAPLGSGHQVRVGYRPTAGSEPSPSSG